MKDLQESKYTILSRYPSIEASENFYNFSINISCSSSTPEITVAKRPCHRGSKNAKEKDQRKLITA